MDLSRPDSSGSEAFVDDLTLITADDQFLDGIAAGRGDVFTMPQKFSSGFPAGSLAPLLATWRSELINPAWPSQPTVEQVQQAVEAVRQPVAKRSRRSLKPILGVAVAISALLFGSAAVGAQSARPGDALWPLTQVLYSDHANSVMAGVAANKSLASARSALKIGDATAAMQALDLASGDLKQVNDTDGKAGLLADYQTLLDQATNAATSTAQASRDATESAGSLPVKSVSSVAAAGGSTAKTTTTAAASSSAPTTTTGSSSVTGTAPTGTSAPTGSTVPLPPVTLSTGPAGTTPVTAGPTNPSSPASGPTDPSTSTEQASTAASSTSDPATTDATAATSTDSPSTESSTTSEMPTPTPTPTDNSTDPVASP